MNNIKKISKKPKILIQHLFEGKIKKNPHSMYGMRIDEYLTFFNNINISIGKKRGLRNLILDLINKKINVFDNEDIINVIINLFEYGEQWIKNLDSWERKSYNNYKQISSLIRHLICKYDVPKFMDKVWYFQKNPRIKWYILISQGINIRTIKDFPITYTKKMSHHFLQAPDNYEIDDAIYWGYIHGVKGNERIVKAILGTKISRENFLNFKFWSTVIQWFINNSMLDPVQFGPICDYIYYIKYENQRVGHQINPPLQPDFSMKGRTPDALLRNMEIWHQETQGRRGKIVSPINWEPFDIENYNMVLGKDHLRKTWYIIQLTTSKELIAEGKILNHCVGSYRNSCAEGITSIFSMGSEDHLGQNKNILTIEVSNNREIREIRGKRDRLYTNYEKSIIYRWAQKENLKFSRWI